MRVIEYVNLPDDEQSQLTMLLCKASAEYYGGGTPIMTDYAFDRKLERLTALENKNGFAYNNSPNVTVGAKIVDVLKKSKHEEPALSLDKVKYKDREQLLKWLGEKKGVLSWKMDGLTVVVTYDNGRLTKAVTRGDGYEGSDITHNAIYFEGLPVRIDYEGHLVVRGECTMSMTEFERVNAEAGGIYENPRNLASATIQMLDSTESKRRKIVFTAFDLVTPSGKTTRVLRYFWLKTRGFNVVDHETCVSESLLDVIEGFKKRVYENDFPTDGLVLTYNDQNYARSLGNTGHHPRGSIAMKWTDETETTTVREIEWSVGKTGVITPVAIFDTVRLGVGSNVSRASLHNISIMQSIPEYDGEGKVCCGVGSKVKVCLSNMIIPMIVESTNGKCETTDKCPVCGGDVELRENNGVKTLYCINDDCPAKQIKKFATFAGKGGLDIKGLSESKIESLLSGGYIKKPIDFYRLKDDAKRLKLLSNRDGWGEKSVKNLLDAIEESRHTDLQHFLVALSIPLLGRELSKELVKIFDDDVDKFVAYVMKTELLSDYVGIGPVKAMNLYEWCKDCDVEELKDLVSELKFKKNDVPSGKDLSGLTFVITGSVHHYKNRDEFKAYVENCGGKVAGSVSGKTNYLVNNDATSTSSKNRKAMELGVEIITEDEFVERFG